MYLSPLLSGDRPPGSRTGHLRLPHRSLIYTYPNISGASTPRGAQRTFRGCRVGKLYILIATTSGASPPWFQNGPFADAASEPYIYTYPQH